MDLFASDPEINLLPIDGLVNYHGPMMSAEAAANYYEALSSGVPWKNDEVVIFGKRIVTSRKVAWFGEVPYSYSGTTKEALPWSSELQALKAMVEERCGTIFNSCLLNLYHDGSEGMGWHSDDEKSIERNSCIASVSFGAERKFSFKHKRSGETASIVLESGSLLLMKGETQTHWLHSLPKSKRVKEPRINLTFRRMVG
ncbi:MAG: alpha-ketoglutarate-dependent dioxygenase AlkB [Verrucomicrobiales bacterium VVV1]|nr:MAG: alpha-ketoglutarate-dependent dioxygenase AlkB [Verrucomicrobiales bacterium VVV1]